MIVKPIPTYLLVDDIIVETYVGENEKGEIQYSDPFHTKARVEIKSTHVQNSENTKQHYSGVVFNNKVETRAVYALKSRVTHESKHYTIMKTIEHRSPVSGKIVYYEVYLD